MDPRTHEDDMHASLLELVKHLLSRLGTPVVRIVNDDLTSLYREEVPDLVLKFVLDLIPQLVRCLEPRCCTSVSSSAFVHFV